MGDDDSYDPVEARKARALTAEGRRAEWFVREDEDCCTLRIELGADRAVTLKILKRGETSAVDLWTGEDVCRSFDGLSLEDFRRWTSGLLGVVDGGGADGD
jgi:hypothetical protein